MPERGDPLQRLATGTSRRGFLARVSQALVAIAGGSTTASLLAADPAAAYTNFCGHTWTTGNCPHPTGLPRVDRHGRPLRARDGRPVDDLGRPIDGDGRPLDDHGRPLRDLDGRPLPAAPRTPICAATGAQHGFHTQIDGSWYRCCGGQVRRLMDCCAATRTRVNGDAALVGYCYAGRKVFCVQYFDTGVPC
jgi:hypothetical protein